MVGQRLQSREEGELFTFILYKIYDLIIKSEVVYLNIVSAPQLLISLVYLVLKSYFVFLYFFSKEPICTMLYCLLDSILPFS